MEEFITIEENVQTEITEKKSKFIANLFYIENVEEAEKLGIKGILYKKEDDLRKVLEKEGIEIEHTGDNC